MCVCLCVCVFVCVRPSSVSGRERNVDWNSSKIEQNNSVIVLL